MAFLVNFSVEHRPPEGAPPERATTRSVALGMKRSDQEAGLEGSHIERLSGEVHVVTGGALAGPATIHIAHGWDNSFSELVTCIVKDAGGNLDQRYSIDVFTTDLHTAADDPTAEVVSIVAGVHEVLLVMDAQAIVLGRLWVLFEALVAVDAGKLRVRSAVPGGFGCSEKALRRWEGYIDAVDWVLAQTTRKSDEKRMRLYADKVWEINGKGIERMLVQLKKFLRREVYAQILIGAVGKGDFRAVEALLEAGADPAQQDEYGNTVEELAASYGYNEVEELLFDRRMRKTPYRSLSSFFTSSELMAASNDVPKAVLAPFFTEPASESEEDERLAGPGAELLFNLTRQSEASTNTPASSRQDWRSGVAADAQSDAHSNGDD